MKVWPRPDSSAYGGNSDTVGRRVSIHSTEKRPSWMYFACSAIDLPLGEWRTISERQVEPCEEAVGHLQVGPPPARFDRSVISLSTVRAISSCLTGRELPNR